MPRPPRPRRAILGRRKKLPDKLGAMVMNFVAAAICAAIGVSLLRSAIRMACRHEAERVLKESLELKREQLAVLKDHAKRLRVLEGK